MNRFIVISSSLTLLFCISSCIKDKDYVEQSVSRIFKLENIELYDAPVEGWSPNEIGIQPIYSYEEAFDTESRQYYSSLDTLLVFKGKLKISNSNYYLKNWNLIDLRITSMDIKTLIDIDGTHQAGTTINDLFSLSYWYKHSWLTIPVSDITFGSVMLGDFFPGEEGFRSLPGLTLSYCGYGSIPLPPIEIHITDSFGREFTAHSSNTIAQ